MNGSGLRSVLRERPDFKDLPDNLRKLVLEYASDVASDHLTDAELAETQLGAAVAAYLNIGGNTFAAARWRAQKRQWWREHRAKWPVTVRVAP